MSLELKNNLNKIKTKLNNLKKIVIKNSILLIR